MQGEGFYSSEVWRRDWKDIMVHLRDAGVWLKYKVEFGHHITRGEHGDAKSYSDGDGETGRNISGWLSGKV